ncbi:hypothetical protein AZ66_17080 [Paenibacillus sp. E194]|nr:hypothetical protein AZ66_17080 [Paenibacillus sp. E194]
MVPVVLWMSARRILAEIKNKLSTDIIINVLRLNQLLHALLLATHVMGNVLIVVNLWSLNIYLVAKLKRSRKWPFSC